MDCWMVRYLHITTESSWKPLKFVLKGFPPPKKWILQVFFCGSLPAPPKKGSCLPFLNKNHSLFQFEGGTLPEEIQQVSEKNGFFQLLISRKATHQQHQVSKQGNDHHSTPILRRQVCSWLPCPSGRTLNEASSCPWWSSGTRFRWAKKRCFFWEIWWVGRFFVVKIHRGTVEKHADLQICISRNFDWGHV